MQPFRAEVERVSTAVSDTVDFVCAKINALWNVEHNDDGTHGNVTADSLTVSGATVLSTVTATSETVTTETVGTLTVTTALTVNGSTGLNPTDAATNGVSIVLASGSSAIPIVTRGPNANLLMSHSGYSAGTPVLNCTVQLNGVASGGLTWQAKNNGGTGGGFVWLDAAGNTLITTAGWTTPAFNAGDYTGGGGWTVQAADVTTAAYERHGKTVTYATQLVTTSVTGGNPTLSILIPGGFIAAKVMGNACAVISDNGVVTTGNISVAAGGTTMNIQRTDGANWTASVNNTTITAELRFEIQ